MMNKFNALEEAELDVNQYIDAVAAGYGFGPTELIVTWDKGSIKIAEVHEVLIETIDGAHTSRFAIDHSAVVTRDRRKFMPSIEAALTALMRPNKST